MHPSFSVTCSVRRAARHRVPIDPLRAAAPLSADPRFRRTTSTQPSSPRCGVATGRSWCSRISHKGTCARKCDWCEREPPSTVRRQRLLRADRDRRVADRGGTGTV